MKAMVEKIYKKILKPFLDEVEVATKKESKNAYLKATEQAFVAVNSIEKKLEKYTGNVSRRKAFLKRHGLKVPTEARTGTRTRTRARSRKRIPSLT